MHNCYVPSTHIHADTIHIGNPERHHLLNVLRLTSGDSIQVFDGKGNRYIAHLTNRDTPFATALIQCHQFHPRETPHITLFQAIPKSDKMDWIVQKVTEIGVDVITPMISQRSIPKRTQGAQRRQHNRWNRIAIEACKQSGRAWFSDVLETRELDECFKQVSDYDLSLLLWEDERHLTVKTALRSHDSIESIALFTGPEGGFAPEEVELAIHKGCTASTFGRNILRTETSAIVAVALSVYEFQTD